MPERVTTLVCKYKNIVAKGMNTVARLIDVRTLGRPVRMYSPEQLRAARALLGWSRTDLADASGTAPETIVGFETRGADSKRSTMIAWRNALGKAGVEFTDATAEAGAGVRFRGKGR